jgi:hypothetical protein
MTLSESARGLAQSKTFGFTSPVARGDNRFETGTYFGKAINRKPEVTFV